MSLFEGPDADDPKVILRERAIMCQLDHPFVPRLYATFKDDARLYMLIELMLTRIILVVMLLVLTLTLLKILHFWPLPFDILLSLLVLHLP